MAGQDQMEAVREYWEKPETVSLRDENLRRLEAGAVMARIPQGARLLDVGCGDGVNTLDYAAKAGSALGVDYSASMIDKAKARLAAAGGLEGRVEFRRLEVEELDQLPGDFDAVVTQRCLINLCDFAAQRAVLEAIHRRLKPGGVYLMLECFAQGLDRLNGLRARFDMPPIPPAWHNCQFQTPALEEALAGKFTIQDQHDFSLYFLATRVLSPLLGRDHTDPVSQELDEAARRLADGLGEPLVTGIGAQRLLVLAKV